MTATEPSQEPRPISRHRKLLFALVAGLLTLVVMTGLGEVVLRLRYGKIERITGAAEWQQNSWRGLTYFWDEYHPRFGWTNLAGYRGDDRVPFEVTINGQGLRGRRDYAQVPPPGVKRIAVFGDSCVFGEEVDDDETVPVYLQEHLKGVEVLNFGVHGYGLGQMALRLEEEGLGLHPDHVVVVLLVPQDLVRTSSDRFSHGKPVFSVVDSELRIGNTPVPTADRQPWLYRHVFSAAWLWGRPRERQEPASFGGMLQNGRALLQRMKSRCDAADAGFTLVQIIVAETLDAMQLDPGHSAVVDRMRRSVLELDVDTLDLVEYLARAYAIHDQALLAERGHWSPRGNCMIARRIAEHLARRDLAWVPSLPQVDCEKDLQ